MRRPMDGKVAMITGAGRGIGRTVALELASRGATLVLTDRNAGALSETASLIFANLTGAPENKVAEQHICREADVTDLGQVVSLCQDAITHLKRIDVLVNNAAIAGPTRPVAEVELGDWEDVLHINLTGAFICAKAVLPHMMERRSGKIINMASIAGKLAYVQIPTKSPAYSDFNAPTIPILIRAPFRDIPAHFRGLADDQS